MRPPTAFVGHCRTSLNSRTPLHAWWIVAAKSSARDEMLPLAAESIMHKIGEAISRLPDDFTKAHPSVRWRPMKGMRNKIAHEYRIIDHDLIWNSLEQRLPQEAAEVRKILDQM